MKKIIVNDCRISDKKESFILKNKRMKFDEKDNR